MSVVPWRARAIDQAQAVDRSRLRSLATVEAIVASARELVAERGGEPFTTQELVARSGCSLQTIYRYFPSKDALLLAVFEEVLAEGNAAVRDAVATFDDPVDRFRALVGAVLCNDPAVAVDLDTAIVVSLHTRLALLFPDEVEQAQHAFVELLVTCIDDMVTLGHIAPRASARDDAHLVNGLLRATYQTLVTTRRDDDRAAVAAQVTTFCLDALGLVDRPTRARARRSTA